MKQYAFYQGDELKMIGTINEIAEKLNIKPKSVMFYSTPTYAKRTSEVNSRRVVLLEDDDEV